MRIAFLTSGGVDSSVGLILSKNYTNDVTAFYIKIWMKDDLLSKSCPWEEDLRYLREICSKEKLRLEVVSLQKEYWENVVKYLLDEVKVGRTPNPDIFCNSKIKFGIFLEKFGKDFDFVGTGHYARVLEINGRKFLGRAKDRIKDQTYFLSQISESQLEKCYFPIGDYEKKEVRKMAEKFNLPNAKRPDSQGICFLGKFRFKDFLKFYIGEKKGKIVEKETGKILGEHKGFWFYTIGQRSGLGLPGGPYFVVEKKPEENLVFVSTKFSSERVKKEIFIQSCNWIVKKPDLSERLFFKIRHTPEFETCVLEEVNDGKILIKSNEPISGVSPGQFAVFYDEKVCFGGGVIV